MRMGFLRHKVRVLRPIKGQDQAGATVTTWQETAVVYAAIQPQKTVESQVMVVSQGKRSIKMTMIYIPPSHINRECQIDFNGRLYSINSITNVDERNRELIVEVSEYLKPS